MLMDHVLSAMLCRCKLAQSLMSEYPDILNMSITGAQEQSEQFSYDNECVISLLKRLFTKNPCVYSLIHCLMC